MIDPFWWCRHDEEVARMVWEQVCQPMLLKEIERLDDPATWGLPPDDVNLRKPQKTSLDCGPTEADISHFPRRPSCRGKQ